MFYRFYHSATPASMRGGPTSNKGAKWSATGPRNVAEALAPVLAKQPPHPAKAAGGAPNADGVLAAAGRLLAMADVLSRPDLDLEACQTPAPRCRGKR